MRIWTIVLSLLLLTRSAAVRTVIIGDSMFWSGPLFWSGQPSPLSRWLESRAGHAIENHARVGASLAEGWVESIPHQYQDVAQRDTITSIIMDGGGNDIMSHRHDCEAWNTACQTTINASIAIATSLLDTIRHDGIGHVFYLGFYHLPGLETAADEASIRMHSLCSENCHFVDPRNNITLAMIGPDGVHPTDEGYRVLAAMIWEEASVHGITI